MPPTTTDAVVRLRDVSKIYDQKNLAVTALDKVSLEIARRSFAMIVGPSGSGKTTLLNLIGCIDSQTSGQVEVCGNDVRRMSDKALADFRAHRIGFIFQNFSLLPVLSAYENVEYALQLLKWPAAERRRKVTEVIDKVGLAAVQHHRPNQLSGGQKQRVAVARALVKAPEVILADEPTANLDSRTGRQVIDLMRAMQEEFHTTFVFSTHDPQLISEADDTYRICDGKLVEYITKRVDA